MRNALSIAAAVVAFSLPTAARADETAREANALAALDALDAISTRAGLASGLMFERNPVARPFVRTTAGAVVYFGANAIVSNVVARLLRRTSPNLARGYLAGIASLEVYCVANNVRDLGRR
jgi:hypothetical protein